MEVHKPKPWHGFREFLKEYLIIVVGVLTALGGEQVVEWVHWKHVADEAEIHLAAGLRDDLINSAELLMIEPCMWDRVRELTGALAQPPGPWKANPQPLPEGVKLPDRPVPMVFGAPGRIWPHVGWDAAVAASVLNHMPRQRVDAYAEIYRLVEFARERQSEVQLDLAKLVPLGFDRNLSEAERTAFIAQVAETQHAQNGMMNSARQILKDAHAIGVDPNPTLLAQRISEERRNRGACVRELKLPLAAS